MLHGRERPLIMFSASHNFFLEKFVRNVHILLCMKLLQLSVNKLKMIMLKSEFQKTSNSMYNLKHGHFCPVSTFLIVFL